MSLGYQAKVGEIVHCNFGRFFDTDGDRIENDDLSAVDYSNFDGRIPPEIIKRRLVMILNPRLKGSSLVVPISAKEDEDEDIKRKYHVEFPYNPLRFTQYQDRQRWVKSNIVQTVSNQRLDKLTRPNGNFVKVYAEAELVKQVQIAVINAINAQSLLPD